MAMAKTYKTKKKELVCSKCGYRWQRRKETLPKQCPKCKTRLYQAGSIPKDPGRPKVEIDKDVFEKLCSLQCTKQEICDFLAVDDHTLSRWCKDTYSIDFSLIFAQKRAPGKVSLRRTLMQQSQNVPSIAIFLAKNWLGMSDRHDVNVGLNREAVEEILEVLPKDYADAIRNGLSEKGKK